MIKQNTLVAKANGAIPANGKSFEDISPDRKRALCKAKVLLPLPRRGVQ